MGQANLLILLSIYLRDGSGQTAREVRRNMIFDRSYLGADRCVTKRGRQLRERGSDIDGKLSGRAD